MGVGALRRRVGLSEVEEQQKASSVWLNLVVWCHCDEHTGQASQLGKAARTLRPHIEQCVSDVNERALQFLSDAEVALLISIVEKINAGLDKDVR